MNKWLLVFLGFFLGNTFNAVYAEGYAGVHIDGIYYDFDGNNAIVVNNSRNTEFSYYGDIVIPSEVTYNGQIYNVTSIASEAFMWEGITSIKIPNSVTSIGGSAFRECRKLTSIMIPNSVTNIEGNVLSGCSGLTSITVESGNIKYDSRNDCNAIIETSTNELITGCRNTTIPNSVTSIGDYAFEVCNGLTSITIPNSVTSIGDYAFENCNGLTSITIPNSVIKIGERAFSGCDSLTSITVPKTVITIGDHAFTGCNGLNSILVESGNIKYDSRNGCNAIIETSTNELITGCKNTTIPNSVTSIGDHAFTGCYDLTSITIPNSVTTLGSYVFSGCSSLTSVTIPNSVTSIEFGAFSGCSSLTSIVSEIVSPFRVYCFGDDTYTNATLTVPKGTKAAYQATEGWNKFVNIVEDSAADEIEFIIDGTTYQGFNSDNTALVKSVDPSLKIVEIPSSVRNRNNGLTYQVTSIADNAFKGCNLNYLSVPATITTLTEETFSGCSICSMSWNANTELSPKAFRNTTMSTDYNFLLYVNSADYAPHTVKNVVVGNMAETIALSDSGDGFYCPKAFTAKKISYAHHFGMETGGNGKGWETIALPFNVQKISHATRGEIVPFASYNGGSSQKPFWLASMASGGFRSSSSIQANTPYIIAMPNSNKYQNEYNLAGDVTFSAENVSVPATPTFSGTFVPAYSTVTKSSNVHALNVVNKYVSNSGGYDAGSRFISNLRDVRPFEAYISQGSSTRGIIEIGFGDGTTGMAEVMATYDADRLIDIHTLNGQKVAQAKQSELDVILDQLPHGVYIINGKKIVK